MKRTYSLLSSIFFLGIITCTAQYKVLQNFNGAKGASPWGALILSGNVLYGMTSGGGAYGDGCIFSVDTNGNTYKVLFSFNGTNGASPYGSLTRSGGMLFGMTYQGGSHGNGNVFSLDTNGSNYKDLYDFNGSKGCKSNRFTNTFRQHAVWDDQRWGCK